MPVEIERRFLVANDGWKQSVIRCAQICDGLIAIYRGRKTRVRILDDRATITLKGQHDGLGRAEYEYAIPIAHAQEMLRTMCDDRILVKTRHYVPHAGLTWEIDVYNGILQGVTIAEVELEEPAGALQLPGWAGEEITGDLNFSKINLFEAAKRRQRAATATP
jgi:CYTH domain-containing protein